MIGYLFLISLALLLFVLNSRFSGDGGSLNTSAMLLGMRNREKEGEREASRRQVEDFLYRRPFPSRRKMGDCARCGAKRGDSCEAKLHTEKGGPRAPI